MVISLDLEYFDNPACDSLTNRTVKSGVMVVSGSRTIFLGKETLEKLIEFIKDNERG
jgi:hypothetical protein